MTPIRATEDGSHDGVEDAACYGLGEHVGAAIARRLRADGHDVRVVNESRDPSAPARATSAPSDAPVDRV